MSTNAMRSTYVNTMEHVLTTMDPTPAAVQMGGRVRTVKSVRIFKKHLKR